MITGTFWRVGRPALWPWLAGAAVLVAAVLAAARRFPAARAHLTIGLGVAAGIGALVAVTTFAARDAPSGRVAWLQIAVGIAIGAVLAGLLVALRGRRRVHAAGIVGGIAAAASLGSLPVFWHGVVISALPATPDAPRVRARPRRRRGRGRAQLPPRLRRGTPGGAAVIELLAALALGGDPSVKPWPIGPGPAYRPPAAVRDGGAVAGHACRAGGSYFRVHLELFAHRRVVIVPPGIGVTAGCSYPARTRTPTGVVEVAAGARLDLGDLFRIWGQPLGAHRLASFRSELPSARTSMAAPSAARSSPSRSSLAPRSCSSSAAYVAPHSFFLFPKGTP